MVGRIKEFDVCNNSLGQLTAIDFSVKLENTRYEFSGKKVWESCIIY